MYGRAPYIRGVSSKPTASRFMVPATKHSSARYFKAYSAAYKAACYYGGKVWQRNCFSGYTEVSISEHFALASAA